MHAGQDLCPRLSSVFGFPLSLLSVNFRLSIEARLGD